MIEGPIISDMYSKSIYKYNEEDKKSEEDMRIKNTLCKKLQ